jgi:hypothetical protein
MYRVDRELVVHARRLVVLRLKALRVEDKVVEHRKGLAEGCNGCKVCTWFDQPGMARTAADNQSGRLRTHLVQHVKL